MSETIKKDLSVLSSINPVPENEAIIRNLCHSVFSEAALYRLNNRTRSSASAAEKKCLFILNELEKNKILTAEKNDYLSFYNYDLPMLIKNTLYACETILANHSIKLRNNITSSFFCVCNEKLITRAVCEIITYFQKHLNNCEILFSVKKTSLQNIISAEVSGFNRLSLRNNDNAQKILKKTVKLLGGSLLFFSSEKKNKICIILPDKKPDGIPDKKVRSYIDLLSDKTDNVYVCLSSLM